MSNPTNRRRFSLRDPAVSRQDIMPLPKEQNTELLDSTNEPSFPRIKTSFRRARTLRNGNMLSMYDSIPALLEDVEKARRLEKIQPLREMFDKLPMEIILKILRHAVVPSDGILTPCEQFKEPPLSAYHRKSATRNSLLIANHMLNKLTLDILFNQTTFRFNRSGDFRHWLLTIPQEQLSRVQNIELAFCRVDYVTFFVSSKIASLWSYGTAPGALEYIYPHHTRGETKGGPMKGGGTSSPSISPETRITVRFPRYSSYPWNSKWNSECCYWTFCMFVVRETMEFTQKMQGLHRQNGRFLAEEAASRSTSQEPPWQALGQVRDNFRHKRLDVLNAAMVNHMDLRRGLTMSRWLAAEGEERAPCACKPQPYFDTAFEEMYKENRDRDEAFGLRELILEREAREATSETSDCLEMSTPREVVWGMWAKESPPQTPQD